MSFEAEKLNAVLAALDMVEEGMTVGLGTGSTADFFIRALAEEVADGLIIKAVPTSEATTRLAEAHGIPLVPIEQVVAIHLTVDGADEIDEMGHLIKGGGGALLREKIIAKASDHMVVIADPSKQVTSLGRFPLPVEVAPFGFTITAKKVYDALCGAGIAKPRVVLRKQGETRPAMTDNGNYILDCHCGTIPDAPACAAALSQVAGVVEHGLFLGVARTIVVGNENGATLFEY